MYGFINNGSILGFGTFDELASKKKASLQLKIRGKNISENLGLTHEGNNLYSKSISGDEEVNALIHNIIANHGEVYEVVQQKWSLEQLYFMYIKGSVEDVIL